MTLWCGISKTILLPFVCQPSRILRNESVWCSAYHIVNSHVIVRSFPNSRKTQNTLESLTPDSLLQGICINTPKVIWMYVLHGSHWRNTPIELFLCLCGGKKKKHFSFISSPLQTYSFIKYNKNELLEKWRLEKNRHLYTNISPNVLLDSAGTTLHIHKYVNSLINIIRTNKRRERKHLRVVFIGRVHRGNKRRESLLQS